MMQVISHTPFYVWPLFAYLLWGGWKSTKTYSISWKSLLIMPAIMFLWSIYAIITRYGSLTVRGLQLKFDKKRNLIEIAGNWTPMILSMSIFSLRYFLGAAYGLYPDLAGNTALLILENVATAVSGMFTGRLVGYWQRSKASHHVDLGQVRG
jgi:uncharacterized protein with PQ loop repeat